MENYQAVIERQTMAELREEDDDVHLSTVLGKGKMLRLRRDNHDRLEACQLDGACGTGDHKLNKEWEGCFL